MPIARSEQERARLIEGYKASGLSAKAFCERANIAPSTFHYWLSMKAKKPAKPRIARVLSKPWRKLNSSKNLPSVLIEVGDARVHVTAGFDHSTLVSVLDLLDARGHCNTP